MGARPAPPDRFDRLSPAIGRHSSGMVLPSLESLRCFAAAAQLFNFRAAARAVALTPAALGQRIQRLEEELEVTALPAHHALGDAHGGRARARPVRRACLAAARECVRAARGETGPAPMELTLGTRQELGLSWIVPQLDRLTKRLPSLELHLYFGSGTDLLLRVRTLEIDCAVTSSRFTDPKLDAIRLHREDYVLRRRAQAARSRSLRRARSTPSAHAPRRRPPICRSSATGATRPAAATAPLRARGAPREHRGHPRPRRRGGRRRRAPPRIWSSAISPRSASRDPAQRHAHSRLVPPGLPRRRSAAHVYQVLAESMLGVPLG